MWKVRNMEYDALKKRKLELEMALEAAPALIDKRQRELDEVNEGLGGLGTEKKERDEGKGKGKEVVEEENEEKDVEMEGEEKERGEKEDEEENEEEEDGGVGFALPFRPGRCNISHCVRLFIILIVCLQCLIHAGKPIRSHIFVVMGDICVG